MDWLDRMNAALAYIEENLTGRIDMAAVSQKACCSEYHFTRMFSFIMDIPLSEYIRRRKLTLAGFALTHSDIRISELAYRYGYESQGAFARAFLAMHGVTPTEARKPGARLMSFPRVTFSITIKGGEAMEYRVVEQDAWTAFGQSFVTKTADAYKTVPEYWANGDAEREEIIRAAGGDERTLVYSLLIDEDEETLRYARCLKMPEGGVDHRFERYEIPKRTWAVFPKVITPESGDGLIPIWKRVWTEWFPSSGYEQDTGPRQERCFWRDDGMMIVEAWVPVVKR